MKKVISLMLAAVLSISALSACSGKTKEVIYPDMTPVSPSGAIDTVAEDVRTYLQKAANLYDNALPEELETVLSPKTATQSLYESKQPVTFRWDWNSSTIPADSQFTLQLSLTEDFAQYEAFPCTRFNAEVTEQSEELWNLMTGTTYYWRIAATRPDGTTAVGSTLQFTTEEGPRLITIDGVSNARDMGGWTITHEITLSDGTVLPAGGRTPQGLAYRTGRLEAATEAGRNTIFNELNLKTEIDLRAPTSSNPNECATQVLDNYISGPISAKQYLNFIKSPISSTMYLRVFADKENYPIVVHCNGGKDRTGALAFILGALQGVSEADLIKDFEFSHNRLVQGATDSSFRDFPAFLKAFHKLNGETTYEKARTFCQKANLSDEKIDSIIRNLRNL